MQNKINFQQIIINAFMGLILYSLIAAKRTENTVYLESAPVDPLTIESYTPKYFKDKEYFDGKVIPKDYYANWLYLAKELDKIRTAYGGPILVIKGYELPMNGLLSNKFNICRQVWIFPQDSNWTHLQNVTKTLFDMGKMSSEATYEFIDNHCVQIAI